MRKRIYIILACVLLFFQLLIQINLAETDSQTSDEAIHLFSGYSYLTSGDFRYNVEHPPLMKEIAALPLLFIHPNIPTSTIGYDNKFSNFYFFGDNQQIQVSSDFLYHSGNNSNQILFSGRVMMIILTLLLGVAIFSISSYFWGWGGGLIAVALYCFDPLINGHGHIVTNDLLLSLTTLLTLFAFWFFLQNPIWKRTVIFGVLLALAELSKFSAVILYPFIVVTLVIYVLWQKKGWKIFWLYVRKLVVVMVLVYIIILAGYGFKLTPPPAESSVTQAIINANNLVPGQIPESTFIDSSFNHIRYLLVPREYYLGLTAFLAHGTYGHAAYLFGNNSNTGWWYYFPVVFSAKTPIITLIIIAVALVCSFLRKNNRAFVVFLLGAVIFNLIFAMMSKVDIGLRHIMTIYPILFVFAGIIGERFYVFVLLFILFIQSMFIYPYYLSYFNILYGGSWNGYKVAVDSNLDWGQEGERIQKYINEHQLKNVYLEYWNGHAEKFSPTKNSNLIIGATALLVGPKYTWLKGVNPTARITPSVFLYSF